MNVDHELITELFMNGANVYFVNTCILCYELSAPDSRRRASYETILRDFVSSQCRLELWNRARQLRKRRCVPFEAVGLLDQPEALPTVSMERNVA
jgi:hypothetical protein